jgi:nicotinate-nucleotide adenylyltransferase
MNTRWAMFGGSFDPVHYGHLVVAELLRELERLDRVFFIPTWRSPHKSRARAAAAHRLAMLRLALRGNPALRVSVVELQRGGPSYTIDTVRRLRRRWGRRPILLLGGDALLDLPKWRESDALLREARVVVFARPGAEAAGRRARALGLRYHEVALSSVSSSTIRRMLRRGLSIRYQVPETVRRYIERHALYSSAAARRSR